MSEPLITAAERDFLVGLEALSRRTGVQIGGCGCCGSPYLTVLGDEERQPEAGYAASPDRIRWVSPSDDYEWNNAMRPPTRPVKADTPTIPKDFPA